MRCILLAMSSGFVGCSFVGFLGSRGSYRLLGKIIFCGLLLVLCLVVLYIL